jgi:hypothetical protein
MIKNLFLVAGASFVLAVACFAGAAAIGWRDFAWGGYGWPVHWAPWRHWDIKVGNGGDVSVSGGDDASAAGNVAVDGATATRQIAWSGADSLDIEAPASVTFPQAPGPGSLTIKGPKDVVERVRLSGSTLDLDGDDDDGPLTIVMTAPDVRRFSIGGVGDLTINNFNQDELDVDVSGSGDAKATGRARATHIGISGNGDVDLSGLKLESADADISGSGHATLAPTSAADLRISGSGEVHLLTHPTKLDTDVTGSGRIVEGSS